MTLAEAMEIGLRFRHALIVGLVLALLTSLVVTPFAMKKLKSAGITGIDIHKPHRPEVAEMGGIAVFLAFNGGAFAVLGVGVLPAEVEALILAALIVCAGACVAGVIDDLVPLQQSFKALIPFAFAAPLALYVPDFVITFPILGPVTFGLVYPVLLVPLAIASCSNSFNMLEGFNGLAASLGILMAFTISLLAVMNGNINGLALLVPLIGALGGFLIFNFYPAKIFPGDTMTLFVGATLACGAILSKVEFWAALLFIPHIVEFMIKGLNGFPTRGWGGQYFEGKLRLPEGRRPVGLGQLVLKLTGGATEWQVVLTIVGVEVLICLATVGSFSFWAS